MSIQEERISYEELLRRYADGERDFIDIVLWDWRKGLFKDVDLSGINLERSGISIDLSGAILRNANFRNSIWGGGTWENIDFTDSDMTGVNFADSCYFIRCDFSGTIWTKADLWQSTFKDCNVGSADFKDAKLVEVNLYG